MKRLFSGERVQAQGEVLGYREGDNHLESAPVGDFNPMQSRITVTMMLLIMKQKLLLMLRYTELYMMTTLSNF